MNALTARRALLPVAVALLALVAACGGNGDDAGTPPASAGPVAGVDFNEADVTFAQTMIAHHQQALEMAQLAQDRAEDPELAELAAGIVTTVEPEITTMTGWLTAWSQPTTMPGMEGMEGMDMPGMATEDEMAALMEASGVEFDQMFAQMMMSHHDGAIQMCQEIQTDGMSPDAQELASTMEQEQSAERDTLQGILDRL